MQNHSIRNKSINAVIQGCILIISCGKKCNNCNIQPNSNMQSNIKTKNWNLTSINLEQLSLISAMVLAEVPWQWAETSAMVTQGVVQDDDAELNKNKEMNRMRREISQSCWNDDYDCSYMQIHSEAEKISPLHYKFNNVGGWLFLPHRVYQQSSHTSTASPLETWSS